MPADENSGEVFVNTIAEKEIDIPIIVCSSLNLIYKNVYGNIWYSERNDWENKLQAYIKKLM